MPARVDELLKWCQDRAIFIDERLCIAEDAIGGCCVQATADIGIYELVVAVPKTALLSVRTSALSRTLSSETSDSPFSPYSQSGLNLATCILYEQLLAKRSFFAPYLESLPHAGVALPYTWRWRGLGDAWKWTDQTEVARRLARAECNIDTSTTMTMAAVLVFFSESALPKLREAFSSEHLLAHVEEDQLLLQFVNACSLVSSRAFVVDMYHGLAMVPIADMCVRTLALATSTDCDAEHGNAFSFNHAEPPHVQLETDDIVCPECGSLAPCEHEREDIPSGSEELCKSDNSDDLSPIDTVDLRPMRPAAAGSEIFNTYGSLSNTSLLLSYGFSAEEETDWERYVWEWSHVEEREELLQALNLLCDRPRESAEGWSAWQSFVRVCTAMGVRSDVFESPWEVGSALGPPQQGVIETALSEARQHTAPSPLCSLGNFAGGVNPQLDDIFVSPMESSALKQDVRHPLFVDAEGRVSTVLWRLSICAALAHSGMPNNPMQQIKAIEEALVTALQVEEGGGGGGEEEAKEEERSYANFTAVDRHVSLLKGIRCLIVLVDRRRLALHVAHQQQKALTIVESSTSEHNQTQLYAVRQALQEYAILSSCSGRLTSIVDTLAETMIE